MKKFNIAHLFMVMVLALVVAAGCTKEGPAGPAGADGTNGTNGTEGADGTTACVECHSSNQVLFAIENQWGHSTHALGGNYERNTGECAICHTSQGFLGNIDGSYDYMAEGAMISNPNPPNCYTCHKIHDTYTSADLVFTFEGPTELRNTGGSTVDFGKANLCASCHQGGTVDPFPVEGGAEIVVTSPYWGLHHGPQANTLAAAGLFEPGTGYNANHQHFTNIADACVTCHMAEPFGAQAGGHTMNIAYYYHGSTNVNHAGCISCHDAETLAEKTQVFQDQIAALLVDLKVKLDAAGITAEGSYSPIPGTYQAVVAGACLNYKALTEDRSLGVHNPSYIKKILENSIAAF